MGMLVAFSYKKLTTLNLPAFLFVALAIGGIIAIYIAGNLLPSIGVYPKNNSLFRIGCQGLAAFVVVLCTVQLDAATSLKAPGAAILLGDASYALYLIHVPVISMAYSIFAHFTPHPSLMLARGYVLMAIVLVFGAAIFFHVTVDRRLISFFHRVGAGYFRKQDGESKK